MSTALQYMLHENPLPGMRAKGILLRKSFKVPLIELLRPDGYWPCVSACNFDPLRRGIGVQF